MTLTVRPQRLAARLVGQTNRPVYASVCDPPKPSRHYVRLVGQTNRPVYTLGECTTPPGLGVIATGRYKARLVGQTNRPVYVLACCSLEGAAGSGSGSGSGSASPSASASASASLSASASASPSASASASASLSASASPSASASASASPSESASFGSEVVSGSLPSSVTGSVVGIPVPCCPGKVIPTGLFVTARNMPGNECVCADTSASFVIAYGADPGFPTHWYGKGDVCGQDLEVWLCFSAGGGSDCSDCLVLAHRWSNGCGTPIEPGGGDDCPVGATASSCTCNPFYAERTNVDALTCCGGAAGLIKIMVSE